MRNKNKNWSPHTERISKKNRIDCYGTRASALDNSATTTCIFTDCNPVPYLDIRYLRARAWIMFQIALCICILS